MHFCAPRIKGLFDLCEMIYKYMEEEELIQQESCQVLNKMVVFKWKKGFDTSAKFEKEAL